MILPVWLEKGEGGEAFHKLGPSLRPCKALEQLLEDEPGRKDLIRAEQGVLECRNLRRGLFSVSAQGQRPYARIDEHVHRLRARSAL